MLNNLVRIVGQGQFQMARRHGAAFSALTRVLPAPSGNTTSPPRRSRVRARRDHGWSTIRHKLSSITKHPFYNLSKFTIAKLTKIFGNFRDGEPRTFTEEDPISHQLVQRKRIVSKIFDNEDFGYYQITMVLQKLAQSRREDAPRICLTDLMETRDSTC